MRKIASPQDLQGHIQALLAYCQKPQPSRQRIASELRRLAHAVRPRTAAGQMSGQLRSDIRHWAQKLNQVVMKVTLNDANDAFSDLEDVANLAGGLAEDVETMQSAGVDHAGHLNDKDADVLDEVHEALDDLKTMAEEAREDLDDGGYIDAEDADKTNDFMEDVVYKLERSIRDLSRIH